MKKNKQEMSETEKIKKDREDSENATLGVMIGGMLFVLGIVILFINPQMGLLMLALSGFPICEAYRGIISIRNRKITNDPLYIHNDELVHKVEENNKRLKLISKIKIIDFLVIIIFIVIIIMTN